MKSDQLLIVTTPALDLLVSTLDQITYEILQLAKNIWLYL